MSKLAKDDRMFGLDLCRTIAVLMVVTGHMLQHSTPHPFIASFGFIGLFGVDLFFCLSGFLIGKILLNSSVRWILEKESGLMKFWYRRWMRTLPLYFFFFFISLKYDWTGATTIFSKFSYLIFSQNILWPMPEFYGLTWSLAVEEWFYFSFPLILLFAIGIGMQPRSASLVAIAIFLLLPPLIRWYFIIDMNNYYANFDEGIRKVMLFRLDSIGFGVAVAYIFTWHYSKFQILKKFWWLFLMIIFIVVISTKYNYFGYESSVPVKVFYFSISGFAFAGLLPVFYAFQASQINWLNKFVRFTSSISYSMYLAHIFAFMLGINLLQRLNIHTVVYPNPWLIYLLFFLFVYMLSSCTYFFIEKPFLRMRDKTSRE